jgi:hypothetical protein
VPGTLRSRVRVRQSAFADGALKKLARIPPLKPLLRARKQRKALTKEKTDMTQLAQQPKRRPRLRRCNNPPPMVLTERDRMILAAVYKHRFLTRDHIAAIFFPSSPLARRPYLISSCNSRLQKLFHHGYLARATRGQTLASSTVYALDRRGAGVVARMHGLDPAEIHWSPKRRSSELYFREHTLAINDLWVAFELAAREYSELAVTRFEMDGPLLWDFTNDRAAPKGHLPVRPDAFLQLAWGDKTASFFLEVDRGTMTTSRFAQKIRAYRLYWKSGGFQRAYEAASFRVLTSAPSERRRDNLRKAAARVGESRMFLFAVHEAIRSGQLFEPIWLGPSDAEPMALVR